MVKNLKRAALAGLVLACYAGYAQAAQYATGTVELRTNDWDGTNGGDRPLISAYGPNGALASLDTVQIFDGLNAAGDAAQMTVVAQGTGQVSSGALKASASISVSNPVMTEGQLFRSVYVQSYAWLRDSLTVGDTSVTSIQFGLRIDGSLAASDLNQWYFNDVVTQSTVALFQYVGNDYSTLYSQNSSRFSGNSASFDDYVLTSPISVVGGVAALNIQLATLADVTINRSNAGDFFSESLFNHTINFVEVYAYDSTGAQVALPDVRGSSGFLYQAAAPVPEPEQYALLVAGLGLIACVAGRRRASSQV